MFFVLDEVFIEERLKFDVERFEIVNRIVFALFKDDDIEYCFFVCVLIIVINVFKYCMKVIFGL